ncbi:signaling protein [Nocardioides gansuensis]|uniref:Signaling protein n=1 Tax=Nocardioides gansuensis TaxID=2138300 RepID=A0A2T8FBT3_9ACTN|nr:PDZ domain-containing protein [Nocardioides gansuensis]PVG83153.1 signaling protein [Nocardioides gansuensis]
MSQRTLSGLLAAPLLVAMWLFVMLSPLPYVTYRPGPTVDILAEQEGKEIVEVSGHQAYYEDGAEGGELRLTTIYVDQPEEDVNLVELMEAWLDDDSAVYPREAVYAPDETDEDKDVESSVQMVSSQDAAIATALKELDYDVEEVVEILHVSKDMPADGKLEVRDVLLRVGDTPIREVQDVVDAVEATRPGQPLPFVVRRDGKELTVEVTPREVDGNPRVGISPGPGFTFPFEVNVDVGDNIGGPSAGLMFSLAIYDTLTPGSLTGGHVVAGSGTIDADGKVGPIGGVQQKIAGAEQAQSELFLMAADNCADAAGVDPGDMLLVSVTTMHEAREAIETWVDDPDATLPTCEDET